MPWSPSPARPILQPGQAHVFRLALDLPAARLEALRALLDEPEQARAARYHFDSDRQRFAAAHGQAREILGACLGLPPAELRFAHNRHGKPALVGPGELRFNLSHSGPLGLLALCLGQEVGVDLEAERERVGFAAVARRFFAPGEVERLLALPADQQRAAFFTCWTRKEAYLKGRGEGLSISLSSFEVSLAPGEPPQVFTLPGRVPHPSWRLYDLYPGTGFTGALSVQGPPVEIRCWDWPAG